MRDWRSIIILFLFFLYLGDRVVTRPGFPGMSLINAMLSPSPVSRQDKPRDAKCPGFQGKVEAT